LWERVFCLFYKKSDVWNPLEEDEWTWHSSPLTVRETSAGHTCGTFDARMGPDAVSL
jgi:hypothetical protein